MDANRYFNAMHSAMSTLHPKATLLLSVELLDQCGNDACLELKQLPGEDSAVLCYSTIGRRELDFQLFRKGWLACHDENGHLTGKFPSRAADLLNEMDLRPHCRADRLDAKTTTRILTELRALSGNNFVGTQPQNTRTGAQITVHSFIGCGASWTYWAENGAPCAELGAILYWLADLLAGSERRLLQSDSKAAQLALQWQGETTVEFFFHPAAMPSKAPAGRYNAERPRSAPTCARVKSWQSILAVMATV